MSSSVGVRVFTVLLTGLLFMAGGAQAETCKFFTGWVDNQDGTVTDPRSGLIWMRLPYRGRITDWSPISCSSYEPENYQVGIDEAKLIAKKSHFLGKTDWRLPTQQELHQAVGRCAENHKSHSLVAVSQALCPMSAHEVVSLRTRMYWSSTPREGEADRGWAVDFETGDDVLFGESNKNRAYAFVRLVRDGGTVGGQPSPEFANDVADQQKNLEESRVRKQAAERKQEKVNAQESERLSNFRRGLNVGSRTSCGLVIEVRGQAVKIALDRGGAERWFTRDQVLPPNYLYCI